MFKWNKANDANLETERKVMSFAAEERQRRGQAEIFLMTVSKILQIIIPNFIGSDEQQIDLGNGIFYSMEKQIFYTQPYVIIEMDGNHSDEGMDNILSAKGKPFWESIQQIMEYTHTLLDDLERREEGRKQLIQDMELLNNRMNQREALWFAPRL